MRPKFMSGMLYSTFRRACSSVQPDRHRSSARRFVMSTRALAAKAAITQKMEYAQRYGNATDLVCPVTFFKEQFAFLRSLRTNDLLNAVGKKDRSESEVSDKASKAVRSLAELILDNHALGIALGDSLNLRNLRISRSLGKFCMLDPPKEKSEPDFLIGDFGRGADILEELARLVLGPNAVMPKLWLDFIGKMRAEYPEVELIIYHSLFLPTSLRYFLRVFLDQRFRKDFSSLTKDQKDAVREFMRELGKARPEDVEDILENNKFLKFASLKSRRGSRNRKGKSNSLLKTEAAVLGDKGRTIMAINRDGAVHGCKDKLD